MNTFFVPYGEVITFLAFYRRMPKEFMERKDWTLLSADNNTVIATMRHPGFNFRDYDKNGNLNLLYDMAFILH